ncbi:CRISPR-associated DxTHG motif protein [Patescibacteria group bacterium]|nr:CRISPR-associated DxTHG motif protein [Patescibacteria group bacterium]
MSEKEVKDTTHSFRFLPH